MAGCRLPLRVLPSAEQNLNQMYERALIFPVGGNLRLTWFSLKMKGDKHNKQIPLNAWVCTQYSMHIIPSVFFYVCISLCGKPPTSIWWGYREPWPKALSIISFAAFVFEFYQGHIYFNLWVHAYFLTHQTTHTEGDDIFLFILSDWLMKLQSLTGDPSARCSQPEICDRIQRF